MRPKEKRAAVVLHMHMQPIMLGERERVLAQAAGGVGEIVRGKRV